MAVDDSKWPWVGPRPYAPDQRHKFRGREEDLHRIVSAVEGLKFVWLTAASAVGKTSLIRAGLMPELYLRRYNELLHARSEVVAAEPPANPLEPGNCILGLSRGFPLLVRQWGRRSPENTFAELLHEELRESLDAGKTWHEKRVKLLRDALDDTKRELSLRSIAQLEEKLEAHLDQAAAIEGSLVNLAATESTGRESESDAQTMNELVSRVRRDSASMIAAVTASLGNVVIILDQFEEILADPRIGPQATAFVEEIFSGQSARVRQLVSMREDSRHLMKPLEDAGVATSQRYRDLPALTRKRTTAAFTGLAKESSVVQDDAGCAILEWLITSFSPTLEGVKAEGGDKDLAPVDLLGLQAFLYSLYEEAVTNGRAPVLSNDALPEVARVARDEHGDEGVPGLADDYLSKWIGDHLAAPDASVGGQEWDEVLLLAWQRVKKATGYLVVADGRPFDVNQAACALKASDFQDATARRFTIVPSDTNLGEPTEFQITWVSGSDGGTKPTIVVERQGAILGLKVTHEPAIEEMVKRVAVGFQRWLVTPNLTKRSAVLRDLVEEAIPVDLRQDIAVGFETAGRAAKAKWTPDETLAMVYATCQLALARLEAGWVLKVGTAGQRQTYELVHDGYAAPLENWSKAQRLLPEYFIGSVTPEISTDIRWVAATDGDGSSNDVKNVTYSNLVWQSCLVTGANFQGVTFADCRFERTLFRDCSFGSAAEETQFVGGSLRNATFEDCRFGNLRFGHKSGGASVVRGSVVDMEGAVLRECDLTGVTFCDTRLKSAEFRDCELRDCAFVTEWFDETRAQTPNRPIVASPVSMWSMLIDGGVLDNVRFEGAAKNGSVCVWRSGLLSGAAIRGALTFRRVSLVGWTLEQPQGEGAWSLSFEDCDLTAAAFVETDLARDAVLGHEVSDDGGDARDDDWVVRIERTCLRGAAFLGATLDGVLFAGEDPGEKQPPRSTAESVFFRESPLSPDKNTVLRRVEFRHYDAPGLVMRDCRIDGRVSFEACRLHRAGFINIDNGDDCIIDLRASDISTAQIMLAKDKNGEGHVFKIKPMNRNTIDVFLWPWTGAAEPRGKGAV